MARCVAAVDCRADPPSTSKNVPSASAPSREFPVGGTGVTRSGACGRVVGGLPGPCRPPEGVGIDTQPFDVAVAIPPGSRRHAGRRSRRRRCPEDHLHPHRRGAAAGDVLVPARSSRRTPRTAGVDGRDARHLPRRPHPRPVPGPPDARAADRRRPRRARRAGHDARGQHHQAAEHQRLDPAAQGGHRRAAGAGLRPARLPGRAADRRGEGHPRPLRQGQGQRRQPGAARGQLRPPRARARSRTTPASHPHSMGAWSPDSKTNVAT